MLCSDDQSSFAFLGPIGGCQSEQQFLKALYSRLRPYSQSFHEGGYFACPETPDGGAGFRFCTHWLWSCSEEMYAMDTIFVLSLCLAPACWCVSESRLYTRLKSQNLQMLPREHHLQITWLWWSAGLMLLAPQNYTYLHHL